MVGDIGIGSVAIPQNTWAGALIALVGVLFAMAAVVSLPKRRRPSAASREA